MVSNLHCSSPSKGRWAAPGWMQPMLCPLCLSVGTGRTSQCCLASIYWIFILAHKPTIKKGVVLGRVIYAKGFKRNFWFWAWVWFKQIYQGNRLTKRTMKEKLHCYVLCRRAASRTFMGRFLAATKWIESWFVASCFHASSRPQHCEGAALQQRVGLDLKTLP